ncbi:hypothetical protein H6F51_18870 [Cyanobacteria bacterium FACHB-DQ100]|nr:hypothetical protein [Cyanobacteria bacterium FACHB-DQ100]
MSSSHLFQNRVAVLATMHHKEVAIAPVLEPELGLKIHVPKNFNTDQFGTFTREITRSGDQLEAARRKALSALEQTGMDLAIASEGSFAPYPALPMLPCNREVIVLIDQLNGLEVIGEAISTETNFNHRSISSFEEAYEFAMKAGFPDHKLVVMVRKDSIDRAEIVKSIAEFDQLREAVSIALARSQTGSIHIETDMRAMHNPTRMKAIGQATRDLVEKLKQCCPNCSMPGFTASTVKRGLPCDWCGSPTDLVLAKTYQCQKCGFEQDKLYPDEKRTAEPMYCSYCNP